MNTEKIRQLNDILRKTFIGGQVIFVLVYLRQENC